MKKLYLFLSISLLSIFLSSCGMNRVNPLLDDNNVGLASLRGYDELKSLIEEQESNYYLSPFLRFDEDGVAETMDDGGADKGGSSFTETNVQVAGVDEGDRIKTDGNRIYTISDNKLIVVEVNDGIMTLVLNETIEGSNEATSYTYYSELYLNDNYLIVIGQRYDYNLYTFEDRLYDEEASEEKSSDESSDTEDYYIDWYYWGSPETVVEIFSIQTLEKIDDISISGYYLTSRMIDDVLYLISNHDLYIYNDEIDPRPRLNQNENTYIPDFEDIKYIPESEYQNFTILTSVHLDNEISSDIDVFLGPASWGQTYVSKEGIYLASNTYNYNELMNSWSSEGLLVSYLFDENGLITFGGKANYEGTVLNQFSLDRHEQYFRMVTTEGWGEDAINRLYIFEQTVDSEGRNILNFISELDKGIGKPNETIRSARFNEDIVTVVTFEQTDPLYIIDLSDPYNPKITSEIEVTGFGTYQHPWGDNFLLVIGYETSDEGRIIGLKVSLFDTSDGDNITQVGESVRFINENNAWSYSEALFNHKAILIDMERNLFGFSINNNIYSETSYMIKNNYYLFEIDVDDKESPITIKSELSHFDFYLNSLENIDNQEYISYYNYFINRGLFINDTYYLISDEIITSYNSLNDFELIEFIDI